MTNLKNLPVFSRCVIRDVAPLSFLKGDSLGCMSMHLFKERAKVRLDV